MRYILTVIALMLVACDQPPPQKIAEPQREALEKARGVEQTIQQNADETRQQMEDAE